MIKISCIYIVCLPIMFCTSNHQKEMERIYNRAHKNLRTGWVDLSDFEIIWQSFGEEAAIKDWFSEQDLLDAMKVEIIENKPPYLWFQRANRHVKEKEKIYSTLHRAIIDCCMFKTNWEYPPESLEIEVFVTKLLLAYSQRDIIQMVANQIKRDKREKDFLWFMKLEQLNKYSENGIEFFLNELNSGKSICEIQIPLELEFHSNGKDTAELTSTIKP